MSVGIWRDHRWGHMTTNLVEFINYVLKGMHNLPVTAISVKAHEHLHNVFTYLKFATRRVEESYQRAGNIVVNRFDRRNEVEWLSCHHFLACCANQHID
ncbi:hypothetical protein Ahy_B06g082053 [Arachis hypogaea]|uniref:Uncharacterized protein n=1 Tax=Arachis hypogaea TaxID=3818 RepID=A0A444YMR3_ARAHY|nr:hypothetical protein Ahy_B06g082053 [Arachis hypogaea]